VVAGTTVVDISGQGANGTLSNGGAYSSTDRAFGFDGSNDYLYKSEISGWSDNISHTTSFWFKILSPSSGYAGGIYQIYNTVNTVNNYSAVSLYTGSAGKVIFYHFNNDYTYNIPLYVGIWYHVVTVYPGSPTTQKVYINGENVPLTSSSGSSVGSALVLGTSPKLSIGGDIGRNNYYTDGSISNFKLWDVALTAEEVAAEYALGRTGKAINLTDTSLCLGGTVPRAQLDVRGSARFDGNVGIGTTNPARAFEIARNGGDAIINLKRSDFGTGQGGLAFVNAYSNVAASITCSRSGTEGGELVFYTAPNDTTQTSDNPYLIPQRMRINKDGNVGIGTTNPQAKLHVNGAITSSHYVCFQPYVTIYDQNDLLEWKSDNNMTSFNSGITLFNTTDINLNVEGIYLTIIKLNSDSTQTGRTVSVNAEYYDGVIWRTNISNSERSGNYDGATEYHRSFMLNATSYTRWRFRVTHNFTTDSNRFKIASGQWSRLMISKIA